MGKSSITTRNHTPLIPEYSCLYNATLCVYDPYKAEIVDIFYFNGISLHPETRLGGIGVDQETGLVAIAANNAITFDSLGQNITGPNYFLQFDPKTRSVLYELNLATAVDGKYSGYQDVEQDPHGNIYVSGTFPSSILKVKADGSKVTPWYLSTPYNHTIPGLSGLAAYGWLLLSFDRTAEQLVKFDMRHKTGTPIIVPQHPFGNISTSDAIYLPPRYNATVLLIARNDLGLAVLRSKDAKWNSAEYLGVVPNTDNTSYTTGAVQIGDGVYIITDFVGFVTTPGSNSGNKTSFTWTDVTEKIDELLLA